MHLLDNTVAEGKLEAGLQVIVQLLQLLLCLPGDGVVLLCLGEHLLQMMAGNAAGTLGVAFKGIGSFVQLDGHGTVIYLIGDGKGGIVVVCRAHKPDGVGHADFSVKKMLGITWPGGGNQIQHPLVLAGHFQHGQHFRKVILDARQVHFVQHNHAGFFPIPGLIQRPEELCFVEPLGELIEIAQKLGAVTVGGLDGNHGGGIIQEAAEGVGQTGFTGTGNTFQNQQLGRCHTGHKPPDDFFGVV